MAIGSRPVGTFDADWNTVCFKWSGHKRRHGTFNERSPFKKRIANAMAYWRPDRCEVEVQVFSGLFPQPDSGRMKLLLNAHV